MVATIAVGFAFALSAITGYDKYSAAVDQTMAEYEKLYGVDYDIDLETYQNFTDAERANYDRAQQALNDDETLMKNYTMMYSLSMVILSISTFLGIFSMEF